MSRESWKTRPPGPGGLPALIGTAVRRARETAELTQAGLAEAMTTLGFSWVQVTVAKAESGARRVDLPELLGIAAIVRTPVLDLVAPRSLFGDFIEEVADPLAVRELICGRKEGTYDDWPAADALYAAWGRGEA